MAREANLAKYGDGLREGVAAFISALERFEALVRADEQALAAQRPWVGLTEDEIDEIFNNWPKYHLDHCEFAQVVQAKVFEKNGAIAVVIPDALNPKDENAAYAAGWNDCSAEMLKGGTE